MDTVKILIVDDAVVVRRLLGRLLEEDPALTVVGTASNGREGLERVERLRPDLVVLDVDMPELDGLKALECLTRDHPRLPVIMFSSLTSRGAVTTLEALARGAKDYVAKPEGLGSVDEALERVRNTLVPKIKALCGVRDPVGRHAPEHWEPSTLPEPREPVPPTPARRHSPSERVDLLVIGSSTGGPSALALMLGGLPRDLPVPVAVVQHMPPVFTRMLAERLDSQLPLQVREATAGARLAPGQVWIAPGDHHLTVGRERGGALVLDLNQGPPENSCRPAVDVLFRAAAGQCGAHVLGVILTGMGQDGLAGARRIHEAGGQILAQDQASSVVWGMPGYVARAGLADKVLPLESLAAEINTRLRRGRGGALSLDRLTGRA